MQRTSQLFQLAFPEIAIRKLGVRNRQSIIDEFFSFDHHDVEIQSAGTPLHDSNSPRCAFDSLKCAEKLSWSEIRFDGDHLVQIRALWYRSEWLGLFNNAFSDNSDVF